MPLLAKRFSVKGNFLHPSAWIHLTSPAVQGCLCWTFFVDQEHSQRLVLRKPPLLTLSELELFHLRLWPLHDLLKHLANLAILTADTKLWDACWCNPWMCQNAPPSLMCKTELQLLLTDLKPGLACPGLRNPPHPCICTSPSDTLQDDHLSAQEIRNHECGRKGLSSVITTSTSVAKL